MQSFSQNTTKIVEKKILTETRANEIKTHYENKLSIAEQNREREIQKKLENARKNVKFIGIHKFHDNNFFVIFDKLISV